MDDTTGHFTQPDSVVGTISKPTTLNPYLYASGDPINNVDPTGRDWFDDVVSAVLTVAGVVATATAGTPVGFVAAGVSLAADGAKTVNDSGGNAYEAATTPSSGECSAYAAIVILWWITLWLHLLRT